MTFSELLNLFSTDDYINIGDAAVSGGCTICFDQDIDITFEYHDNHVYLFSPVMQITEILSDNFFASLMQIHLFGVATSRCWFGYDAGGQRILLFCFRPGYYRANNVSIPKFGIQALTYRTLDRRKTLNGLVNRISGGSINREVLARKIISNTLSLGQEYVVTHQMLEKRSAEIVSLGRSVLFDNTLHQVKDGVAPLVELILQSKGQGALAQKLASGIAQCIGSVYCKTML